MQHQIEAIGGFESDYQNAALPLGVRPFEGACIPSLETMDTLKVHVLLAAIQSASSLPIMFMYPLTHWMLLS